MSEIPRTPADIKKAEDPAGFRSPPRCVPWVALLVAEGLTEAVFEEEALRLRVINEVRLPMETGGTRRIVLSPTIAYARGDDLIQLRNACARRIGINDFDAWLNDGQRRAVYYKRWRAALAEYQAANGVVLDPERHVVG